MINSIIKEKYPPNGVIVKGLITLLFRMGEREHLGNWLPITLLNVSYIKYLQSYSSWYYN
jgi:hypothetical protein